MHRVGLAAVGVGIMVVVGLDFVSLDTVNPLRRTISEHGLGAYGWIFGLGVAILAAGSAAIGVTLARTRLAGAVGTIAIMVWSVGLFMAATFPKANWAVGPSMSGYVHRTASVVAFLALPLAALVIARPWRHRERRRPALAAFCLGIGSLAWVAGIAAVVFLADRPWWQVMPLGLVERGLAVTEIAALIALGVLAGQRGRSVAIRSST